MQWDAIFGLKDQMRDERQTDRQTGTRKRKEAESRLQKHKHKRRKQTVATEEKPN